jgi:hypothetical protein
LAVVVQALPSYVAVARPGFHPVHDRGRVLTDIACAIAAGGTEIVDIEARETASRTSSRFWSVSRVGVMSGLSGRWSVSI